MSTFWDDPDEGPQANLEDLLETKSLPPVGKANDPLQKLADEFPGQIDIEGQPLEEYLRGKLTETSPRLPLAGGSRHARPPRVWVLAVLVGVSVGIVALGTPWALGAYATPPVGKSYPVFQTVTKTSEPRVKVSTRREWRTREVQVPGPVRWSVSPGPTVTKTVTPKPLVSVIERPGPTVTVTETIIEEESIDDPQLPND